MSIATKNGDGGFTDVFSAEKEVFRVLKNDPRIEFIGTLDELDAFLALAGFMLKSNGNLCYANIAGETRKGLVNLMAVKITETALHTQWLEQQIALLEKENPVQGFVREWASLAAVYLNAARAVCRRAERHLVTVTGNTEAADWAAMLPWLNRLSDLLFLLAAAEEKR